MEFYNKIEINTIMKKYRKAYPFELLDNLKSNFSSIIDYIIYYDSINEDEKAWNLIYKIEELSDDEEIPLIIYDFISRNLQDKTTFLYNALLYGLVNDPESKSVLIQHLIGNPNPIFLNYLATLNKNKGREGDLNIQNVVETIENRIFNPKT